MVNKILSWSKKNYEKLILGILSIILIITLSFFLMAGNKGKELEDFKKTIQPPSKPSITPEPVHTEDIESYIKEKPKSYYQPISDRAVFFPVETKKPVVTTPDMNLQCVGITSAAAGVFVAALRNPRTGGAYNVRAGEQVEIFTVISVTREVVVLSSEGRQYRLNPPPVTMPFKLTGIMPTDRGLEAMLQNEITRRTHFVQAGDKVEEWEVLSISENIVIISKSDTGKYELIIGSEPKRIQE